MSLSVDFLSWLCSVCNFRAELIKFKQEIDEVKNELNLH